MADHRIAVLVAEANQMSRQLMADAFRGQVRKMQVDVLASDSANILKAVQKVRPNIAVISVRLEDGPVAGLKVLQDLRALDHSVPTVLLLDSGDRQTIVDCFRLGARGVFCRNKPFEALCKCIQVVSQGQIWADTAELDYVLQGLAETARMPLVNIPASVRLTKRQMEVMALVADGLTNREIAQHLGLSAHTVKNYLFRIFDKVGVSNRVQLVAYYNHRMLHSSEEVT